MKKWLIILGMITCMMGLTACGEKEEQLMMSDEEALGLGTDLISQINQIVVQQAQDQYVEPALVSALNSWENALEEMGSYVGVISADAEVTLVNENTIDEGVIEITVEGSQRNAVVEMVFEKSKLSSVTTNPVYTFGENMQKAALNTLLGMGTVFVVLILICLIISCFNIIPKIQEKFSKKPAKAEVKGEAVDHTITQIMEKEELSDDLELVAVISAAIAASEGASSTDGFVVRSIRRAGSKWQRA